MTADILSWETVLSDIDGRIELAEMALDEGSDLDPALLTPWSPPEGLGPMPEACRERAIAVLAHHAELEQRLVHAAEQIGREIALANNSSKRTISQYGESVIPKYFDQAV